MSTATRGYWSAGRAPRGRQIPSHTTRNRKVQR